MKWRRHEYDTRAYSAGRVYFVMNNEPGGWWVWCRDDDLNVRAAFPKKRQAKQFAEAIDAALRGMKP